MKYLITGITGQDGIYLTNLILKSDNKNSILGITRSNDRNSFFNNLRYINNEVALDNVNLVSVNLLNKNEVHNLVQSYKPNYIINLSGPSSVYGSYENPELSVNSINNIFENLTSACLKLDFFPKFFQPSSSEMFKDSGGLKLTESSEFKPLSPYAKAKYQIHSNISNMRNQYEWNISSGILFNHESEFRKNEYLFMKIIINAIKIKKHESDKITIGSLELVRDWSYAKDIAEAILFITNGDEGDDYVIGSGKGHTISDLVEIVFDYFDLDFTEFIHIDNKLLREGTPKIIVSNPEKIKNKLGWKTKTSFHELIEKCILFKLSALD